MEEYPELSVIKKSTTQTKFYYTTIKLMMFYMEQNVGW